MDAEQLRAALLGYTRQAYPDIEIRTEPWAEDPRRLALSFIDAKFAALYPAQRYHYLMGLIPQTFWDEHLSNTVWFELAPGENPEDLRYPDDQVIETITPDVMKVLAASGAIEALDDLMCPVGPAQTRAACFGDYRHSREVLFARGFTEEELFDIFHVLMSKGGFCDCEILYNAADASRLKAEYWRARAEGVEPYTPHRGA